MLPPADDRTPMRFCDLADQLVGLPGASPIVAIDGPGGAGKSTFADRLATSTDAEITLLHTDAFARPEEPTSWWPRLLSVIELLVVGQPATFDPYNWTSRTLGQPHTVRPAALTIIEGVSASRNEWREHLSFSIWIDASPDVCRQRGVSRDGIATDDWDAEAAREAAFFARDGAVDRADLTVDSSADLDGLDPEISFVTRT